MSLTPSTAPVASALASPSRPVVYRPTLAWAWRLAFLPALLTLLAGSHTTTIHAGMAFPDWPLSDGSLNPEGWLHDAAMFAEHSHRLMAGLVLLISLLLAWFTQQTEARPGVRKLGWALFALVVSQALLGGLRVLFDNTNTGWDANTVALTFAVGHAVGAQLIVATLAAMVAVTSRSWIERRSGLEGEVDRRTIVLGKAAAHSLLLQALLGAVVRHNKAGGTLPAWPQSTPDGAWLPPGWSLPVALNFTHRWFAVFVTVVLALFLWRVMSSPATRRALGGPAIAIVLLLCAQIYLGVKASITYIDHWRTAHMLMGAMLFGTTWYVLVQAMRPRWLGGKDQPAAAASSPAPSVAPAPSA